MQSDEMFHLDESGAKQDADLHAVILGNPEAEEITALNAVLRGMATYGMSEADALRAFGAPGTAARLAEHRKARSGA